jgi:hypothetical protein
MVTNKAFTIRLGQTQPWSSSLLAQNWYQYHLNIKLRLFFEKFFGDKFFQNRGISFSHVIPRFFQTSLGLEVFLHDSKLYDFFGTKPSRRALKIVKSKKKLKKFIKKFIKLRKFLKKSKKYKNRSFRFKKGIQSRFLVSSKSFGIYRKKIKIIPKKNQFFVRSARTKNFYQTLESKFKKNQNFRARFKNVRKFVKSARKIRKKFFSNKIKFFRPIKIKKSSRNFTNSKFNFILNRRKSLSSVFIARKRFKKKFKKKRFKFKKKISRRRISYLLRKVRFSTSRSNRTFHAVRHKLKKHYASKLFKISRNFSFKFKIKLKKLKIKLLKRYILLSRSRPFSAFEKKKLFQVFKIRYFKKKYAIFNNLRNQKFLRFKKLRKSRLGRKFLRLRRFSPKKTKRTHLKGKIYKSIKSKNKLKKSKKLLKRVNFFSNKKKNYKIFYNFSKNKSYSKFNKNKFYRKRSKVLRYPHWKIRYSPITENSRRGTRFIFFNNLSGYASSRFVRYNFYNFLGKFLSAQIFKSFNIPVSVKFNFFPLHRAGSDFYLNFITTKLYYRYILSDVIKPIVRISLKFYRGFVINCNGRFTRAQIAVSKKFVRKSVSYSKITSSLDYGQKNVVLKYGTCNLRIWIRK